MKKNESANATSSAKGELFNKGEIKFLPIDDIINGKNVNYKGNIVKYPLKTGVTLTIVETENESDYGSLNLFGVSINLSFRNTKKGIMAFYPSYKKSNGEYANHVTSYSKSLNDTIKEVVNRHYNN